MAQSNADALILDYIARLGEVPGFRAVRYMETMHKRAPGTTRNALGRLVKEGKIERVGYGRYRVTSAGQAEHEAGALTTH